MAFFVCIWALTNGKRWFIMYLKWYIVEKSGEKWKTTPTYDLPLK